MIEILCLLFPPVFSVKVSERIKKKKYGLREFAINYAIFTGIVNMLCLGIVAFLFRHPDFVVNSNMFLASFSCKYLLLGCFFSGVTPVVFEFCRRSFIWYAYSLDGAAKMLDQKTKLLLSVLVAFFFAFTIIVFVPYDMFFGNQSDFIFSFSDFWWIMASFGLLVFIALALVIYLFPRKLFVFASSSIFSFTLCCYIQRMFLNLYTTSLTGEAMDVGEHPIWCVVNLFIWVTIVIGIFLFPVIKWNGWKTLLTIGSVGLIVVQGTALISLLFSNSLAAQEKQITTEHLYEIGSENNIITFILDYYDASYVDAVLSETPDFYDKLEGFTYYDNVSSVYSRSFPSNSYLLTGIELPEYHIDPPEDCINQAFSESTFLPDLKDLDFHIDVYTSKGYIGDIGGNMLDNFSNVKFSMNYFGTLSSFIKTSFYSEAPYILKPYFLTYDAVNEETAKGNVYVRNDAAFYQELKSTQLSVGNYKNGYKYIHMHGGHAPYTVNENCEDISEGVSPTEQWKGCVNVVCEYMDQMKKLGVYKGATIIITADHGEVFASNTAVNPILFVKPAGVESGKLMTSHAPISHTDLFPTIIQAANGEYEKYGTPISMIDEEDQRARICHFTSYGDSGREKEILDYEIIGDAKQFENWKQVSSKKVLNSMYGVEK